jgi:hypothetical protein
MSVPDRLIDHLLGLLSEEETRELEQELARTPDLQAELDALRETFYTLPDADRLESPPEGAWQRLMAARRGAGEGASAPTAPPPAARRARPWLALAAALVLATGASLAWGGWQRTQAQRLDREQSTIAYWMLHPEIVILPLEAPAGAEGPTGLLCLLPEGRTMLLQTHPPEGRGHFLLWGSKGGERTLIGETDSRLLVFDRGGFERFEVEEVPRRGDALPVGSLTLDGGGDHNYD